ncbi:ABC transporter ATP-binding protein [Lapillicoccus sp.]|uniref:ABC transporter ATP-binding protein n=1 Tax=Lapillicoccus sp. TaxID=1909287 RepID=UPI0027BCBE14|nr:ABC transporter ATP-binding protein [Actinomycetota bacterium]
MTTSSAVSVRSLVKSYGDVVAVRDVSLEVARGEIVGILGPNGSGKTTTVECLQGLRRPDAGDVSVLGLDPRTQLSAVRRLVGSQLQDSALPARMRVEESIRLFSSLGEADCDVAAVLGEWGLSHRARASFASLSGGERQRLFVALALVNRPQLVFFDEMTTGLDPAARRETWALVEQVRDLGTTVVLVTHFMDEAQRLCDRLVVLRGGLVVATGAPAELVAAHGGGTTATWTASTDDDEALAAVPGVRSVSREGDTVRVRGDGAFLMHLGHLLVENARVPAQMEITQPTLEDAYFNLVGAPDEGGTAAVRAAA